MGKWLTIKKYAEKYDLKSTNVVANWIARGTIPPEKMVQIEELNGIVLVRGYSLSGTAEELIRIRY